MPQGSWWGHLCHLLQEVLLACTAPVAPAPALASLSGQQPFTFLKQTVDCQGQAPFRLPRCLPWSCPGSVLTARRMTDGQELFRRGVPMQGPPRANQQGVPPSLRVQDPEQVGSLSLGPSPPPLAPFRPARGLGDKHVCGLAQQR